MDRCVSWVSTSSLATHVAQYLLDLKLAETVGPIGACLIF